MAARKFLAVFATCALGLTGPARAQQTGQALVVSTCGTLPSGITYLQGQLDSRTQDTTGKLCGNGIGGSVLVVNACGTLPPGITYSQGQVQNLTEDATGKGC